MTVQDIILKYLLEKDCWIAGGTIEREASTQNKPGTINRELRNMSHFDVKLIKQRTHQGILQYGINGLEGGFYHKDKQLIPANNVIIFDKEIINLAATMANKDQSDFMERYKLATML